MPADRLTHVLRRLSPARLAEALRAAVTFRRPWRVIARYTGLRGFRHPEFVATRSGLAFTVRGFDDLVTLWGVVARRDYPVRGDERLIVDAGANFGSFSLWAAREAPEARIIALEPVAATFQRLTDHIRLNGLGGRITPLPVGVAGASGNREINVSDVGAYSSFYAGEGRPRETVRARSLADLLADLGDPPVVDLMKMDCEGAEMEAILGADEGTLRRFTRIAVEYHTFAGFKEQDVIDRLLHAGFRKTRHKPDPAFGSGFAEFLQEGT